MQERPPGTSLFDPGAGALACGGDVCIEILRRQREAQWKIVQENIAAVSEAEWALFWAYTGGQAINAARWGWTALKIARALRTLPMLTKGPGGKMLGEAIGNLRRLPGGARVAAFEKYAEQISKATNGQWNAKAFSATNARVFAGEGGEALVFDSAGNMFRGHLSDRAAFAFREGGQIEVMFGALRGL